MALRMLRPVDLKSLSLVECRSLGAIHLLRWLKQLSRSLTVLKLHHLEMQDCTCSSAT